MPLPAASPSWWDRWFKRQSPSRPTSRQSRPARQARRTSVPTSSASQPSSSQRAAPPAASCPAIVIQQASSGESHQQEWREGRDTPGTGGAESPLPGPSGVRAGGVRSDDVGSGGAGPSGVGSHYAASDSVESNGVVNNVTEPDEGLSTTVRETEERSEASPAQSQQPEPESPPTEMSASTISDGFEKANRVVLRSDSDTKTPRVSAEDEQNDEAISPPTSIQLHGDGGKELKTQIDEFNTAIEGVNSFSYETKEKKKISELTAEGKKLLGLWREALDKKDVLSQIIRECTEAANQSGERLRRDIRDLEELYGELAEALANLQRTSCRHRAVKKDIHAMKKVVGNATAKEQAEVGKVAAAHEKEVYSKWQTLKGLPIDVEALEKLRKELAEKQRAISGLDALVQRRLEQGQRGAEASGPGETRTASPPLPAPATSAGKGIPQRVPPSPGRRGGAGRSSGKRKLSEEAHQERRAALAGGPQRAQQLVMRGQGVPATAASGSSGAATAVATQAGFIPGQTPTSPLQTPVFTSPINTTAGATATVSTATAAGPPPPPPPPPPAGRRAVPEDEDSGPADSGAEETSTSNDDDGLALDAEEAVLAAAFPLQFGPALFEGLDPAEAARAVVDAMNFH